MAQTEKRAALAVVVLRWLAPEVRAMHGGPDVVVLRIRTALFECLPCGCLSAYHAGVQLAMVPMAVSPAMTRPGWIPASHGWRFQETTGKADFFIGSIASDQKSRL